MGRGITQRTTRGMGLENFLKSSLRMAGDLLVKQGQAEATKWLRSFMNSDRHVSIGYAIDRSILPRLRNAERQKPENDRAPESVLIAEARARIIRDFEELLITALRQDQPGFFDDVLDVVQQVAVLGCAEFRRQEMYFLPRNPIAYLRAVVEAYRTSRAVNGILGWKDEPGNQRNTHHAAEARRFLEMLKALTRLEDPGCSKIRALRMSDGPNGIAAPASPPVPQSSEAPTQTGDIEVVKLIFEGEDELALLRVFQEAAAKHGGTEKFILLLAASLARQKAQGPKDPS